MAPKIIQRAEAHLDVALPGGELETFLEKLAKGKDKVSSGLENLHQFRALES